MKTFNFNGPLAFLVYLLLIAFTAMLVVSFSQERSFFVLVLILVNISIVIPMLAASYFRRLSVSPEIARLKTLGKNWKFPLSDVKHFDIVRYRSFRFIYLSVKPENVFSNPEATIVSSEDTFVIQYRKRPWKWIQECMHKARPGLEPKIEK